MSEETVQKATEIPRCDELSEEQLVMFGHKYRLVCWIESGMSALEALQRLKGEYPQVNYSRRWAERAYQRFREQGAYGLLDHRYKRKTAVSVLTTEVKDVIRSVWYARRAAGPKAVWQMALELCREQNLPTPKYDAVKKFIKSIPRHEKLVREGRIEAWDKQARPVVRFNLTTYSNERWQLDHTRLDIWIREMIDGRWTPCDAWLTVALDAHSRSVAGFICSRKQPDAWTTAMLLRQAIMKKQNPKWRNHGLPSILQPDRGRDFMSNAVAASLAFLGIVRDEDPPYYPQRKGRIERFFRTLDTGCLRRLPAHHAAVGVTQGAAEKHTAVMLTRRQLVAEIEKFIVDDYHAREHSETQRKPAELWEETVRLNLPASQDALDSMLLKNDRRRKVRNTGIDFLLEGSAPREERGGRYWAPELAYHWGEEVTLRYNPEDLESVLVYCADTGERLGEAWLMGRSDARYDIADVKRRRSQFRRGLVERMQTYAEDVHERDRRASRQAEWQEARAVADEMAASQAPEPASAETAEQDDVERLLAEFERRDRGYA
ncbi:MAG TPA: Mu transposase C-terminal domain-containing protein [Pyrinomonadaceae bacterium]